MGGIDPLFARNKAVTLAARCRADMFSIPDRLYHRAKFHNKVPSPEARRSKATKRNASIDRRGRSEARSHPS
jgi:hypothetical protein